MGPGTSRPPSTTRTSCRTPGWTILDNLRTAGVQNGRRERLRFTAIDPYAGRFVQSVGTASTQAVAKSNAASSNGDPGAEQRVAICLGPEYGTVDARMVKAAAREALAMPGVDVLLVLGYAFEANALDAVGETQREGFASVAGEHTLGRLPVLLVRMNVDLAMGDELRRTPRPRTCSRCSANRTSTSAWAPTAWSWRSAASTSTTPPRARSGLAGPRASRCG